MILLSMSLLIFLIVCVLVQTLLDLEISQRLQERRMAEWIFV